MVLGHDDRKWITYARDGDACFEHIPMSAETLGRLQTLTAAHPWPGHVCGRGWRPLLRVPADCLGCVTGINCRPLSLERPVLRAEL
jgi:hypothetical protein